jgi:multiple sugar transport system substrate-binding protein
VTTITQWYHQYGEKGTQDAVLRYAKEYTAANPHIAVDVVWVPGDYGTKLATALLVPGGPDVFEGQLSVPMVTAGQVAALDDLYSPDVRRDFSPKDQAMNSVDGKIYGVKMLDDAGVLYYRKSMLAAAGIDPPATMDELVTASKKLSTNGRKGLFVGNDGGISSLLSIAPWSAGTDLLVDNKIVFDNPRAAASFAAVKALNDSGGILLGAPTDWWDPSAFTSEMVAMQWSGLWAYPKIRATLGDDVGALPWPALDRQGVPATFLGGWCEMVNAQGAHVDEAKKYVKWLWIDNTKDQLDWCLSYGFHVPPRISAASVASALKAPTAAAAARNLVLYGHALPPQWNSAMNTTLTDAVSNIVKQGASPEVELAAAAKQCRRALARMLQ